LLTVYVEFVQSILAGKRIDVLKGAMLPNPEIQVPVQRGRGGAPHGVRARDTCKDLAASFEWRTLARHVRFLRSQRWFFMAIENVSNRNAGIIIFLRKRKERRKNTSQAV
jgi:hypothetical protein